MEISRMVKDIQMRLQEIQDRFQNDSESKESKEEAVSRFIELEKEFMAHDSLEIDDATRKDIIALISHIKTSPSLSTILGVMQVQLFGFLDKLEDNMKAEEKKRVNKVNLEQLDPQ